jgi:hypothetical protein
MKKTLTILATIFFTTISSFAIYIGYEYSPRKGKIVEILPPIPQKEGVIYPVQANLLKVSRKYLIVDTDADNNKTLREATLEEKALIDAPSYMTCYDETSPVWLKWSNGFTTNITEDVQTIDSSFWDTISLYRNIMVSIGYDPYSTNNTFEFVSRDLMSRGLTTTDEAEKLDLTTKGLILNQLYSEIVAEGYNRAWEVPSTQIYTNIIEQYEAICE